MDDERRKRLEETTRYAPSEVEGRILESWLEGRGMWSWGAWHPERDAAFVQHTLSPTRWESYLLDRGGELRPVLPSSGRELHAVDLDLAGPNLGEIERQATADVASPATGRKPLAESRLTRRLFGQILGRIARLAAPRLITTPRRDGDEECVAIRQGE